MAAALARTRIAVALAAIYLIWGTTYYVIRVAVQEVPPLSMAAIRFLLPAAALLAWSLWRGDGAPSGRAWMRGLVLGTLMLAIGNGAVTWAATRMPSGVTALLVAMVPMWAVLLYWLLEGKRPRLLVAAGLLLGLAGVTALLVQDSGGWTCGPGALCDEAFEPWFVILVIAGAACWALGSLRSRHGDKPKSIAQDLGVQMLAGGAVLAVGGMLAGEWPLHLGDVSSGTWLGILYLSIFGSIVALGLFLWLLRTTTPATATTYAFVNPVVAVVVGWTFGGEPLTSVVLGAAAAIVAGVALIVVGGQTQANGRSSVEAPEKLTE